MECNASHFSKETGTVASINNATSDDLKKVQEDRKKM